MRNNDIKLAKVQTVNRKVRMYRVELAGLQMGHIETKSGENWWSAYQWAGARNEFVGSFFKREGTRTSGAKSAAIKAVIADS